MRRRERDRGVRFHLLTGAFSRLLGARQRRWRGGFFLKTAPFASRWLPQADSVNATRSGVVQGSESGLMNKIILADSQAIFRAGTAKVLALDDELRIIAQCSDTERMMHAVTTFPGAVLLF